MAAIAQPIEVETSLLRPLTTIENQYVAEWLIRAERLLVARLPDLVNRTQSNDEFKALVASIEGEMVARVFRNPDGFKQEDEGNYSYRLDTAVASGLLSVLDKEWEALGIAKRPIMSVAGEMDGYARDRYANLRPDLQFQYGWPGVGWRW
jgi:hypothetical protein